MWFSIGARPVGFETEGRSRKGPVGAARPPPTRARSAEGNLAQGEGGAMSNESCNAESACAWNTEAIGNNTCSAVEACMGTPIPT